MSASARSDLIDIVCTIQAETERAVQITDGGGRDSIWLPRSQIEIERQKGGIVLVTMPVWLAREKGLV